MSWTDERVEVLKKLWGEGKTAAEIAKELGGVTRNAVIGKAHRLKLSNRTSPIQQNKKPATTKTVEEKPVISKRKAEKAMLEKAKGKTGKGLSLGEIKDSMCRWPNGDPRDPGFSFCGDSAVPSLPYCAEHAKVAYQTASRSRILQAEDFEDDPKKKNDQDDALQEAVA